MSSVATGEGEGKGRREMGGEEGRGTEGGGEREGRGRRGRGGAGEGRRGAGEGRRVEDCIQYLITEMIHLTSHVLDCGGLCEALL